MRYHFIPVDWQKLRSHNISQKNEKHKVMLTERINMGNLLHGVEVQKKKKRKYRGIAQSHCRKQLLPLTSQTKGTKESGRGYRNFEAERDKLESQDPDFCLTAAVFQEYRGRTQGARRRILRRVFHWLLLAILQNIRGGFTRSWNSPLRRGYCSAASHASK